MALDHFVPQVHLKNFYSPINRRLYAIRKSDLKPFTPRAEDICRIEQGSTNAYLTHDRAIETFLKSIEPKYNMSVDNLRKNNIEKQTVFVIAGYFAYVARCSPAAMRIYAEPLKAYVKATATIMERQELIESAPEALGGRSISDLFADGTAQVNIDHKYPQSLGIKNIVDTTKLFGNCRWEILLNEQSDSPFFTSDFPVAIERRRDGVINHIVPLAPDLAIRIIPDINLRRVPLDNSFSKFAYGRRTLRAEETRYINRLIVQCAEDLVFFRDDLQWIKQFVSKYRRHRIEAATDTISHRREFLHQSTLKVVERTGQPNPPTML
jgi:hypothetical protein